MAKKIFSEADIDSILQNVSEIFGDETYSTINLNIEKFQKEIDKILNKVKLIQVYNSHGKLKGYRIKYNSMEKRKLLAEGYLLIFKLREFLIGETIDYRYYYNLPDPPGGVRVTTFSEDNILKMMSSAQLGFKIRQGEARKATEATEYQNLLDLHYMNIMNGLGPAKDRSFLVTHTYIREKYASETEGKGLYKKDGKSPQVFTRGHVFEALDIAFSEAINSGKLEDFHSIEYSVFSKYLNYDNIAGTQGGDNQITMTQIKANAADLLDYATIIKDLEDIRNMLQLKNKVKLAEQIKEMYLNKTKYEQIEDFNKAAVQGAEKLLTIIKK